MESKIHFITRNKNKFLEAQRIISSLKIFNKEILEIQELDPRKIIYKKIESAASEIRYAFVVEDSSMFLDALGDFPGPLIKWFRRSLGNAGIYELLSKYNNFKAKSMICLGFMDYNRSVFLVKPWVVQL